ncbi:unnamed protein product [Calypogeia fissa]
MWHGCCCGGGRNDRLRLRARSKEQSSFVWVGLGRVGSGQCRKPSDPAFWWSVGRWCGRGGGERAEEVDEDVDERKEGRKKRSRAAARRVDFVIIEGRHTHRARPPRSHRRLAFRCPTHLP